MENYISNLKEVFQYDNNEMPATDDDQKEKNEENLIHIQELRKNFFVKAFQVYLEKTLLKNQKKNMKNDNTARSKSVLVEEENLSNIPENLRKIQKLINSRKNKNKMKISSKMDKFEKKMEIFKNLNSFIDIRAFLLESNITNYNNSEELLLKFKSHYKDSINAVLMGQISKDSIQNAMKLSLTDRKTSNDKSEKQNYEAKMVKFKRIIDLSKETISQSRTKQYVKHENHELSDVLCSHLSKNLSNKQLSQEICEESNEDMIFSNNLASIENRFLYDKKYVYNSKRLKDLPINYTENQKKRNDEEMEKLDKIIKKIMLKGVIKEQGDYSPEAFYLEEYKNQYKKIKNVLHRVTKNIFRKSIYDKNHKKTKNIADISINHKTNSTANENDMKSPFITEQQEQAKFVVEPEKEMEFVKIQENHVKQQEKERGNYEYNEENPYFLNERKGSNTFIRKNIKDLEKYNNSTYRSTIKTTGNTMYMMKSEETPIKDKEIAKKPYNFKLNLPKIIGNITEKQASKPYIITYDTSRSLSKKDSLMKQESDSKRSYKHENRVIHKKFDNFLKNLNKNESLQKFLTQDLKDDMGELNKELKKLNLEKEEDNCLRDIDPANFHTATNLRGNAYKKALKKISNLKL